MKQWCRLIWQNRSARRWCLGLLIMVALVWATGTRADDRPEHSLVFVDQAALTLAIKPEQTAVTTTVAVNNTGPAVESVQFFATVQDDEDAVRTIGPIIPTPAMAEEYRVTLFTLTIPITDARTLQGQLVVNGKDSTVLPGVRALSISPTPMQPWYTQDIVPKDVVVWLPALIIAGLLVLRAWLKRPVLNVNATMDGPPAWDIKGSWATNLTAVGAILNLVSTQNILPETTHYLSPAQYSTIALLFAAIALVAPAVFIFMSHSRTRSAEEQAAEAEEPPVVASIKTFLLANLLTLWAVYGQLILAYLVLDELHAADLLSGPTFVLFTAVVALAGLLLVRYAPTRMRETAQGPTRQEPAEVQRGFKLITVQALRQMDAAQALGQMDSDTVQALDQMDANAPIAVLPDQPQRRRLAASWSLL